MSPSEAAGSPPGDGPGLDSTAFLLSRIRSGDDDARERLFTRVLPVLQRWAHGRLRGNARDLLDTDDLVQVTILRALVRLDDFECRGEGAFLAYMRQILLNAIRERIRRSTRRPPPVALDEELLAEGPSALEAEVGRERLRRYEAALATLPDEMQHALILKLEFEYTHQQVADALGKPSPDAARMLIARAQKRLTLAMGER